MPDDAPAGLKHLRPHVDYTPAHVTLRNWWHTRPFRVAQLAIHHPLTTLTLVTIGWLWWLNPVIVGGVISLTILVGAALLGRHPEIHERHLQPHYRGFLRAIRYRFRWVTALEDCHVIEPARPIPALVKVHWSVHVDRLTVKMTGGMSVETFFPSADDVKAFAQSLGVREVRAVKPQLDREMPAWWPDKLGKLYRTRRSVHRFELWMITGNALLEQVAPYELDEVDPLPVAGLPIARAESGLVWLLRYTHILLVGATRSGKSWFLWAIIWALYKAVKQGKAQLWVIDPKRHQLGIGRHLYHRFANTGLGSYVALLEEAVEVLEARQDMLDRLGLEEYDPNLGMWQLWIIVDEMLDLNEGTPKLVRRADAALGKLLREGVAAGVFVIGAVQEPEKALLKRRRWFPLRICFRVTEEIHVRMALGQGMRERGALADEIPDTKIGKGCAYVLDEGSKNVIKIRGEAIGPDMIRGLLPLPGVGVSARPPQPELPVGKTMLALDMGPSEPEPQQLSMTLSTAR